MNYDAIVVGLGAMGSAALFQLARRGARVLGIERFTSPHDKGSTHGESRIIRQAYFEGTKYVPLVQRAYASWAEVERLSGQTLFLKTGGLFFGKSSSDVVRGSIRSAEKFGIAHEILKGPEIRRRFPPINAPDDFVGLYEPTAGVLPPEKGVEAFRKLALAHGAEILDNTEVLGWDTRGGEIEVRTPAAAYQAKSLILTPGAWMPELLNGLDLDLTVRRMTMFWFEPLGGVEPFLPDRFPIYIGESPDINAPPKMQATLPGVDFYGFPALGSSQEGVKIAFHNVFLPVPDPSDVLREVLAVETLQIREYVRRYLPSLDGPLRRTGTCLYTMTKDEHFVIDRHPMSDRVILASCCSGHGFKFAPAIGEALACMTLGEPPAVDVSEFKRRSK